MKYICKDNGNVIELNEDELLISTSLEDPKIVIGIENLKSALAFFDLEEDVKLKDLSISDLMSIFNFCSEEGKTSIKWIDKANYIKDILISKIEKLT